MTEVTLCLAHEVPSAEMREFLKRSFGAAKGEFLLRHGSWWHRGEENRWVLLVDGVIAGYCGVIATHCLVAGTPRPALWWMDLVIAPEFRGKGLQTEFDELVRGRGALLLGFPNALAARIHLHHGWGVREDLVTLLMPLRPTRMRRVRRSSGWRCAALWVAAEILRPAAALWRHRLQRHDPRTARSLSGPNWQELAQVAAEHLDPREVTTFRDAAYLRWRYAEGPDPCIVYAAGPGSRPRLVLIARRTGAATTQGSAPAERWLDLFGDLEDVELLADLVLFAAREAAVAGMVQITVMAANHALRARLRRFGFWLGSRSRFCWFDQDRETMQWIAAGCHHWCLGDSDNDEFDRDEPNRSQ